MCFSELANAPVLYDNLNRPIDFNHDRDHQWNDQCDYVDIKDTINYNPNGNNLLIMHLNVRGMINKQLELNQLLNTLEKNGSKIDIVTLNETFLTKQKESLIKIPNYRMISNTRENKKGGGVAILVNKEIKFKERKDLIVTTTSYEMIAIEIKPPGNINKTKPIIITSLYRPPNTSQTEFNKEFKKLVMALKEESEKEIILGSDQNLDLLKTMNKGTTDFLDICYKTDILPTITRPTRVTKSTGTLIDNIYISNKLHINFESGILISDISDHFPCITLIRGKKFAKRDTLKLKTRSMTDKKTERIHKELSKLDWSEILSKENLDITYDIMMNKVNEVMDKVAPIREVKISGKNRNVEPWFTMALHTSMNKKNKLYKLTLEPYCTDEVRNHYRNYRNEFNKLKRGAMVKYYQDRCEAHMQNTRKLWSTINTMIGKTNDKTSLIEFIRVDNIDYYAPLAIANNLAQYFARVGSQFAQKYQTQMCKLTIISKKYQE